MKILISTVLTAILITFSVSAPAATNEEPKANESIWVGGNGNFNSWRAVSRDELIIWASPSRPYLVKIRRPFSSLRFANSIGVTTTAGRVTKFEQVIVGSERLRIHSIIALDRETAKNYRWSK